MSNYFLIDVRHSGGPGWGVSISCQCSTHTHTHVYTKSSKGVFEERGSHLVTPRQIKTNGFISFPGRLLFDLLLQEAGWYTVSEVSMGRLGELDAVKPPLSVWTDGLKNLVLLRVKKV